MPRKGRFSLGGGGPCYGIESRAIVVTRCLFPRPLDHRHDAGLDRLGQLGPDCHDGVAHLPRSLISSNSSASPCLGMLARTISISRALAFIRQPIPQPHDQGKIRVLRLILDKQYHEMRWCGRPGEEGGEVMMCSMILLAVLLGQTYHDTRDMIEDMQWQLKKQATETDRKIEGQEKNNPRAIHR